LNAAKSSLTAKAAHLTLVPYRHETLVDGKISNGHRGKENNLHVLHLRQKQGVIILGEMSARGN